MLVYLVKKLTLVHLEGHLELRSRVAVMGNIIMIFSLKLAYFCSDTHPDMSTWGSGTGADCSATAGCCASGASRRASRCGGAAAATTAATGGCLVTGNSGILLPVIHQLIRAYSPGPLHPKHEPSRGDSEPLVIINYCYPFSDGKLI